MAALAVGSAAPAAAQEYQPVDVVHTERVQAGPYELTVGFSTWPVRAMQSLDFTFSPDGGITGKSGTLTVIGPDGAEGFTAPLARHPRQRDTWGLDIQALEKEGSWTFRFDLDGPEGPGTGELRDLVVLEQPGPPMVLSWSISTIPLLGLGVFLAVALLRDRSRRVLGEARL
ncbi:hypothetical protein ABZ863_25200 [Saccharomonospora sp. NPDC046836]|uniref:hypothetical protein n=1 Tax=Saccharomonospora sp. NPDC046836 TaxID=3156921 RepID=UPI0033CBA957